MRVKETRTKRANPEPIPGIAGPLVGTLVLVSLAGGVGEFIAI